MNKISLSEKELVQDLSFLHDIRKAELELEKRSLNDPIVYHYLQYYQLGEFTYLQALIGMAIHLSKSKEDLLNEFKRFSETDVRPVLFPIVKVNDDDILEIMHKYKRKE